MGGTAGSNLKGPRFPRAPAFRPQLDECPEFDDMGETGLLSP